MLFHTLLGFGLAAVTVTAQASGGTVQCPIVFDGRIKSTMQAADFDNTATTPFTADGVKGQGLSWASIIKFPTADSTARFDETGQKPLEVTISDASIFKGTQKGFRRAGLQFAKDTNTGSPASTGVKTIHFSVKLDPTRPLNLSHEYLAVWHEASDYSANQFNFELGNIIGQDNLGKNTFKVLDRKNKQVFSTPMDDTAWNNFAVTLDFTKNTLQVYYSKNNAPLVAAGQPVSNDNSGGGQYQMGILKKPTGTSDVVNSGYQERNLNEGLIYTSLFIEDSANGCVSL